MQNVQSAIYKFTVAAVLCAIGIIIPLFSPLKIILEPASFTLASHVAIFIAMFVSPFTALGVSLGVTLGFLFGGFPIVVVLRAASHIVFAVAGAHVLRKRALLDSMKSAHIFSFLLALVHAACEVLIVIPFYFSAAMATAYYAKGFMTSVLLLVGVGTVVHSMIDFEIALWIWKPLKKIVRLP